MWGDRAREVERAVEVDGEEPPPFLVAALLDRLHALPPPPAGHPHPDRLADAVRGTSDDGHSSVQSRCHVITLPHVTPPHIRSPVRSPWPSFKIAHLIHDLDWSIRLGPDRVPSALHGVRHLREQTPLCRSCGFWAA